MTTFADVPNSAIIQITGERLGEKTQIACEFGGVHGERLSVTSPRRVAPRTPLSVEHNDVMFLGEVVAASQHAGGEWHVDVKIEQVLTGLQSLMNLRANLLGEAVPSSLSMLRAGAVC